MGNVLSYDLKDRLIVPNNIVSGILQSDEGNQLKTHIDKAAKYHDNNLMTVHGKKQDSISEYLRDLAKSSFLIEEDLYRKIDPQYANAVHQAFYSNKTSSYLKTPYLPNISLGQGLTNLFYGGAGSSNNTTLTKLLTDLAHLDPHKLIKMTEVSNSKMVANIIASNIDNFMRNLKTEKNIAGEIGGETAQIFSVLFNESNIMSVIQEEDIKDAEIKKAIKDQLTTLQKSKEFLALTRQDKQQKMLKTIQEAGGEMKDALLFLVDELVDGIYNEIAPYKKKGLHKKTLRNVIIDLLKSGKSKNNDLGFSYTRAGAQQKKNGQSVFTLASYELKIDKIEQTFIPYLLQNADKKTDTINIKDIIKSDIFDEAMLSSLQGYNEALQTYITSLGHTDAWDYYQKNFLNEVIELTKRDYLDEKNNNEAISNISAEIRKGINALQIAHSIDAIIDKIDDLKGIFSEKVSKEEINEIIELSVNHLNKDEKDREVLKEIKDLVDNNNINAAIEKIRERLVSKRAGFISNFNGSIGEIFITAIISVVFKGKIDSVYQKGSSQNLGGQSAHADITIDNIGIQSKIYKDNDIKLYDNTTVTFKADNALRYLRTQSSMSKSTEIGDELTSFRFFLLNNTILQEIGSSYAIDDNYFLKALNLRLENFIRYSDGLTKLGNIKNNFYLINFNIVPASVIFLKMAELFDNENFNDLIVFDNKVNKKAIENYHGSSDDDYLLTNPNVLSLLGKTSATFKSFVLKLSDLGVDIF